MVSGGIEKSNAAHIMHLIFSVIDPMYSLAGGLYYIARVSFHMASHKIYQYCFAEIQGTVEQSYRRALSGPAL